MSNTTFMGFYGSCVESDSDIINIIRCPGDLSRSAIYHFGGKFGDLVVFNLLIVVVEVTRIWPYFQDFVQYYISTVTNEVNLAIGNQKWIAAQKPKS